MKSPQIKAVQPFFSLGDHGLDTVWHASELARAASALSGQTVPSGHRELDAQLPGGGWPVGALVEVLQTQSGHNDWRLLLPALCQVQAQGIVVLVGAPYAPFAPGLAGQGLDAARLLCVNAAASASRLWAAEQALRCKDVAAVLAWLPQARADALRRLHIAAAEHRKLLFSMRPAKAQNESSPAVLRLVTVTALQGDALWVNILKRRGPPLEQALTLAARPARLGALLAVGNMGVDHDLTPMFLTAPRQTGAELLDFPLNFPLERSDALDRVAAAA